MKRSRGTAGIVMESLVTGSMVTIMLSAVAKKHGRCTMRRKSPSAIARQPLGIVFAGHNAYRFGQDPFYSNGFIPTVKQLVERILTGR